MPLERLTVGQEIEASREYCGGPDESVLSTTFLTQVYLDVYDRLCAQMQLADKPNMRSLKVFQTTKRELLLSDIDDFAIPTGLMRRSPGDDDTLWRDVPLTSVDDLTEDYERLQASAAVYDIPLKIRFSYDPTMWEHGLLYASVIDRPVSIDDQPRINDTFSNLRKLLTAEICLARCQLKDPETYTDKVYQKLEGVIKKTLDILEPLWREYINLEPHRGPAQRGRFNEGRGPYRSGTQPVLRDGVYRDF